MDDMIKKLSDIEDSAKAIVEKANEEKNIISDRMQKITQDWDMKKELENKSNIEKLRADMQALITSKLQKQQESFESEMQSLEQDYNAHKFKYLELLFSKVIED